MLERWQGCWCWMKGRTKERNPYTYFNSHRDQAIVYIFRLRAGFNSAVYSQNLRHLSHTSLCMCCGWWRKDEVHII
ncbi:unnamed protein product [Blepharisma stoltei]|uniref:Uncharacterized protein n=1 Tax=Blepharisma stoltei TaxID=1481888 RepID=A0AAU9I859_9CILI|nr:unnamed protein product [Blepharisma stoltei]